MIHNRQIKKSLQRAVRSSTPDILDRLMTATPQMRASAIEFDGNIDSKPKYQKRQLRNWGAVCAVCVAFLVCLSTVWFSSPKVESFVSIDVNPSIELLADKNDKVISCHALNDEAAEIIAEMNLEGMNLEDAAHDVVDAIIQHGYLSSDIKEENTILISVVSANEEKSEKIQQKVSSNVDVALKTTNTAVRVIQQTDILSEDLTNFAHEHQISVGKADFVKKLSEKDKSLNPEELTGLSLNELSSIAEEKQIDMSQIVTEYENVPTEENTPEQESESSGTSQESGTSSESSAQEGSVGNEGSSSGQSSVSSDNTNSDPQHVWDSGYCEYCGKLNSECQEKCDHSQGKKYCKDCGKLKDYCVCDNTDTVWEDGYCVYCGKLNAVCQGKCSHKNGERYCSTCGKLNTQCTCDMPDTKYCEYCGELSEVCRGKCSTTGGKKYCGDCGNLNEECICSGKDPTKYCEYCGDLNAECKGKCSHTGGKKYCEDCGELKEDCTCNLQEEYCDVCGNRLEDCTCSESSSSEKSGYCEYCGNPNSVCGGECSHSGGKRYCSGCGNIKEKCTCEKEGEDLKEESSSSESSSVDDASAIDEKEPSKSEDLVSVASSQNSESSLAVDDANSQKTEKRTGE